MERELKLRAHIRTHLLEYCLTHITTNYVTFTEYAVETLLSQSLAIVPTTDPNSLILPMDPLDILLESSPPSFIDIDDKWTTDADVVNHIRNSIGESNIKPMTERCWDEEDYSDWEYFRPMSPILTVRAIRETPTFGSLSTKSLPRSLAGVLKSLPSDLVPAPDILDLPMPSIEEALNIKYTVDPKTRSEMIDLLKKIPAYLTTTRSYSNPHVDAFLRSMSPPIQFVDLDTPPIFPRSRRSGFGTSSDNTPTNRCNRISDLPTYLPEVKTEQQDMDMDHMVVVDGWQAYAPISSPSPTPSLRDGDTSSHIDELLLSPPAANDNYPLEFELARMDDVEIPRSSRFGQGCEKLRPGEGESYPKFLLSTLSQSAQSLSVIPLTTTSCEDKSVIGLSLLGQPPSIPSNQEDDTENDTSISDVWKSVRHYDFADVILQDGLDTKDGLLMEVPDLPPPTSHPNNGIPYQNLRNLISIPSTLHDGKQGSEFLKLVRGIKSLNLELSWIPFKFGKEIPSNEDAARVLKGPLEDPVSDMNYAEQQNLGAILDRAYADLTHSSDDANHDFEDADRENGDGVTYSILAKDELHTTDIVFTREERQRIADIQGEYHDGEFEFFNNSGGYARMDKQIVHHDGEHQEWDHDIGADEHGSYIQLDTEIDYHSFDDAFQNQQDCDLNCNTDHYPECQVSEENMIMMQPASKRIKLCNSFNDVWFPATRNDQVPAQDLYDSDTAFVHGSETRNDLLFTTTRGYTPDAPGGLLIGCDDDDLQTFDFLDVQRDADGFYPLSFGSSQPTRTLLSNSNSQQTVGCFTKEQSSNDIVIDQNNILLAETNPQSAIATQDHILELALPSVPNKDLDPRKHRFANFLTLRGKVLAVTDAGTKDSLHVAPVLKPEAPSFLPVIPDDVLDRNTLRPLGPHSGLRHAHYYLASFDLIQKRVLVLSLSGQDCAVVLIERDAIGGIDLIVDHDTAIVFISLTTLPSECDSLGSRISNLSWRFKHLLVVFECFPAARTYVNEHEARQLPFFAFSPPVMKALKKLRRGLGIAEGSGTKRAECMVMWAFAEDVEAAARFAREFGDAAESRDETGGLIWGSRDWLMQNDGEDFEGEDELASVEGLNAFVACVILSQVTLEDFLDMSAEAKTDYFGPVLGMDRMVQMNEVLLRRYRILQSSPLSSAT